MYVCIELKKENTCILVLRRAKLLLFTFQFTIFDFDICSRTIFKWIQEYQYARRLVNLFHKLRIVQEKKNKSMNCGNNIFHTVDGRQLHMIVNHISDGVVEIILSNLSYIESRNKHFQRILCILIAYAVCIHLISAHISIHLGFWLLICFQLHLLWKLVQNGMQN